MLCVDTLLPVQWSGGGVWDCAFYQKKFRSHEWCLHQSIHSFCCYCRNLV
jgi:hypothetical protein